MKTSGDAKAFLARAHELLKLCALEKPCTAKRKRSLERLRRVLRGLDEVARVMLGETPGATWKGPVQNMEDQIALCLRFWKTPRGYDVFRREATKYLVHAYQAKHGGRSPLTDPKKFRNFAEPITDKYGLRAPGRPILMQIIGDKKTSRQMRKRGGKHLPTTG